DLERAEPLSDGHVAEVSGGPDELVAVLVVDLGAGSAHEFREGVSDAVTAGVVGDEPALDGLAGANKGDEIHRGLRFRGSGWLCAGSWRSPFGPGAGGGARPGAVFRRRGWGCGRTGSSAP